MPKTIYVNCPHCNSFLEVNPVNGKVVRSYEADPDADKNEDKLKAALKKMKSEDATREEKFESTKKEMEEKKDKLAQLFEEERKKIKEEGDIKPPEHRLFDLD